MKIAIASDLYYPMINGVAVFAHNLALGLAARGHEVLVLCPSMNHDGQHYETFEKVTYSTVNPHQLLIRKLSTRRSAPHIIHTVYLKSTRLPFYPDMVSNVSGQRQLLGLKLALYKNGLWVAPFPYKEVETALREFQPDLIHNQTAEMVAMAVQKYAKKYTVPMVSTGHAYPDNITGQRKSLKPIKKPLDAVLRTWMASFLEHSEYATVPTEVALHDLIPEKQRIKFKVPVEAISNGVDLSHFQPGKVSPKIAKKYHLDLTRPTVLYVGRVDPEKSIEKVVAAFAQVVKNWPEAAGSDSSNAPLLLVVGDGTARPELEKLVKKLQIAAHVQFTGKILPPDLYEVYRAGWLFATASKTETQGIVLIEAAATGLPLVAVDAGAVREVCQDQKNGFLCSPDDVEALSAGMTKILTDQKLRQKFSAKSLQISARHDIDKTLNKFEKVYKAAIKLKKSHQD